MSSQTAKHYISITTHDCNREGGHREPAGEKNTAGFRSEIRIYLQGYIMIISDQTHIHSYLSIVIKA